MPSDMRSTAKRRTVRFATSGRRSGTPYTMPMRRAVPSSRCFGPICT